MRIARRLAAAGSELWELLGTGDTPGAIRFLARRLWSTGEMVLFERSIAPETIALPKEIRIRRITPKEGAGMRPQLEAAGARAEFSNFLRGADAYIIYAGEEPVGSGWSIALPAKLARLGYADSTRYLGGFIVRHELRGRGLYPLLLRYMCAELAADYSRAVLETATTNRSSQRGASKAGFRRRGLLRTTLLLGQPLRVTLEEASGEQEPVGTVAPS